MEDLKNIADYQGVIDYSNQTLQDPLVKTNNILKLYCFANAAQCYIKTDWNDRAKTYIDSCNNIMCQLSSGIKQDKLYKEAFYTYSNAMIMYYTYVDIDYHNALTYAEEALLQAKREKDNRSIVLFGLNACILNTQINKEYAYSGAEDLLYEAHKLKDKKLIFSAGQVCAWRHELLGNNAEANSYIEEAIANLPENYMDASTVYADYAMTLHKNGNNAKAITYFNKALNSISLNKSSSSTLNTYLSYADFLKEIGQYDQAEAIYKRGISISDSLNNRWNISYFYRGISDVKRMKGDLQGALKYLEIYTAEKDSIIYERQRKDILDLRIKYETAKKELTIQENEKLIVKQSKRITIICLLSAIIALIAIFVFILYIHKRSSYMTLLRLHQEVLDNNEATTRSLQYENTKSEETAIQRADFLFGEIEHKMKSEFIYRDPELTIDRAAKTINSNRTYLSDAIKRNTGLSFIYYINSYRIKEAVTLLSDSNYNQPLKALISQVGFKSATTFYKLFKEVTGHTPKEWQNMHK